MGKVMAPQDSAGMKVFAHDQVSTYPVQEEQADLMRALVNSKQEQLEMRQSSHNADEA